MEFRILVTVAFAIWSVDCVWAREWTSNDGKTLEAEFVSTEGDQVSLRRPDGQVFTVPLTRLSEADQSWVVEEASKPAPVKPIEGPFAKLVTESWELSELDGQKFAFYGSKTMSADKEYPLVLALHGRSPNNVNGKQVKKWMKDFNGAANTSGKPCFVLAPLSAQPAAGEGYGWNGNEVELVIDLIKAMKKSLPIDPKKIYIVGHSMGGYGACHIMGSEPRMFAAGIAVAGVSLGDADALSRKPVWIIHAADDKTTPVKNSREFAEQMKRNKKFKYSEPATGGHGVANKVFKEPETYQWLFSQEL